MIQSYTNHAPNREHSGAILQTGLQARKIYIVKLQDLLPKKQFEFAHDRLNEGAKISLSLSHAKYYELNLVNDHILKPQLNYLGVKFGEEMYGIITAENLAFLNQWIVNKTLVKKINTACSKAVSVEFPENGTARIELRTNEDGSELIIGLVANNLMTGVTIQA